MKAPEILSQAAAEMADRAATYDRPEGERSMEAAVGAFAHMTGVKLTPTQGWLFMVCLKGVRSQQGAHRPDSFVDGSAYFALAGEAAETEAEKKRWEGLSSRDLWSRLDRFLGRWL